MRLMCLGDRVTGAGEYTGAGSIVSVSYDRKSLLALGDRDYQDFLSEFVRQVW